MYLSKTTSSSSFSVHGCIGHEYNLDSFLHVSPNMVPPATITIAPLGFSPVTCLEQEQ
jgi:hypothetical protein